MATGALLLLAAVIFFSKVFSALYRLQQLRRIRLRGLQNLLTKRQFEQWERISRPVPTQPQAAPPTSEPAWTMFSPRRGTLQE